MATEKTTVTGIVHKILPEHVISEKYSKKEIVLKTEEQYTQYLLIQFTNNNINQLDNIATGQRVTITYNLKGREVLKEIRSFILTPLKAGSLK